MTTVSVVMPTYNRLQGLQRVLQAFEKQTFSANDFEVIVVSDGSTDGTNDYLKAYRPSFPFVPVVQENQGPAGARNNGIDRASGDYILFVDDDVLPHPDLICEHMRYHHLHENSVVIGPMLKPDDFDMKPWVSWEQAMLVKQYNAMAEGQWAPTARQFFTGNASLLRSVLIDAGGFDTSFKRAEDLELAYRLADRGLNFLFNPDAVGFHYAERSLESWLKIPYAYGCNDVKFALEKNQDWLLPTIYREYRTRNFFIRTLCKLCLDHKVLTNLTIDLLKWVAAISHKLNLKLVTRVAYSGIFNLRFYQGVADELGGREKFFCQV